MIGAREARIELLRRAAQGNLLAFLQYVWWMPSQLHIGRHTRELCARLTRAVEDFRAGKDTYLIVNMPFRHGKSDLVSRALPAYFLGRCRDMQPNVIMSGYGSSLVKGFSSNVQNIVESEAYGRLFPGMKIDPEKNATDEWRIKDSVSSVYAQGLGGSITGKGGNLIIIDDYCKNAEEAESQTTRDKTWESFKTDLCTRTNAPAHIIIVCATRWHVDDLVGRIYEEMKKNPDYPRYESLIYPAHKDGPDGWKTLFPEHYRDSWYDAQRAMLGAYSAAALLDCAPVSDVMKEFRSEWLSYYDTPPPRETMSIYMLCDPSSGRKKEVGRGRSDRTAMMVVGLGADGNDYLLDMQYDRLNLEQRTRCAFDMYETWRPANTFYEQVGMQADIEHIQGEQNRLGWHFNITPLPQKTAKEVRIRSLQPGFENHRIWFPKFLRKQSYADGRVYFPVQEMVEEEYDTFPGCFHDDGLDCLAHTRHPLFVAMTSRPLLGADGYRELDTARANTEWKAFR